MAGQGGWRRLILGLIGAFTAFGVARAAAPDALLPGHPGVTGLSLLRQVIADLAPAADGGTLQGHLRRSLPNPAGKTYDGDAPDPVTVNGVETLRIVAGGHPRLVLMADLGQAEGQVASTTLLALFDDGPTPKLLDAVDVGLDRDTGFSEHPRLKLGPADEAVVTYSEHSNTSATYGAWMVLFVRHDRFALAHLQFALSTRACGWQDLEAPIFATRPDPGAQRPQIVVSVTETLTNDGQDGCGDDVIPKPRKRVFHAVLRWNAARERFETVTSDLNRLDRLNRARF